MRRTRARITWAPRRRSGSRPSTRSRISWRGWAPAAPLGTELLMGLMPEVIKHVESCYPEEGCGVIFTGPRGLRALALKSVYDKYHARFPDQFPRTNRTAYRIDELELQRAIDAAE